jgi:uncharacterized membrane protein
METLRQIFFRGLITLMPIALTIYILYTGLVIVENALGSVIKDYIPPGYYYVPGIGFILTIFVIFLFGLLLNTIVIKSLLSALEKTLGNVPLIKTIYSPLKDLMNLFSKKDHGQIKSVVFVQFSENSPRALGLVTRETFDDLAGIKAHSEGRVAVFFPLSYGLGGFTFLVPKKALIPVDIPIERAMTLAITGWVKTNQSVVDQFKPEELNGKSNDAR